MYLSFSRFTLFAMLFACDDSLAKDIVHCSTRIRTSPNFPISPPDGSYPNSVAEKCSSLCRSNCQQNTLRQLIFVVAETGKSEDFVIGGYVDSILDILHDSRKTNQDLYVDVFEDAIEMHSKSNPVGTKVVGAVLNNILHNDDSFCRLRIEYSKERFTRLLTSVTSLLRYGLRFLLKSFCNIYAMISADHCRHSCCRHHFPYG